MPIKCHCVSLFCVETEGESIEDSVQKKAFKLMEPFNTNDAELRDTCMTGRCSYQQVLEMVTPRNLAVQQLFTCFMSLISLSHTQCSFS